jgi:hypothetical protein
MLFTLFACSYRCLSPHHSAVFFSHNKSTVVRISQPETIQRTDSLLLHKDTYTLIEQDQWNNTVRATVYTKAGQQQHT